MQQAIVVMAVFCGDKTATFAGTTHNSAGTKHIFAGTTHIFAGTKYIFAGTTNNFAGTTYSASHQLPNLYTQKNRNPKKRRYRRTPNREPMTIHPRSTQPLNPPKSTTKSTQETRVQSLCFPSGLLIFQTTHATAHVLSDHLTRIVRHLGRSRCVAHLRLRWRRHRRHEGSVSRV